MKKKLWEKFKNQNEQNENKMKTKNKVNKTKKRKKEKKKIINQNWNQKKLLMSALGHIT